MVKVSELGKSISNEVGHHNFDESKEIFVQEPWLRLGLLIWNVMMIFFLCGILIFSYGFYGKDGLDEKFCIE